MSSAASPIKVSVVVLNYNGVTWLPRCYESLRQQTIFKEIEIILTDNNSSDDSVKFTNEWLAQAGAKGRVVQNRENLVYCGANNNGAAVATGEFLLFLNNDTWLEPDCLEKLYEETRRANAKCAAPEVQDYDDNTFQSGGESGIDFFGVVTGGGPVSHTTETFASPGCSLFIETDTFRKIGGFPPELLIYVDETDLSMRVWIAGEKVVCVPSARVHHRGAAVVNPQGNTKTVEMRTTETKRYLTNRNEIFFLVKNFQHILLLLLIPHFVLLLAEAVATSVMVRRWSYIKKSYVLAVVDVWRMRKHVFEWRKRIHGFRKRGDLWMLRFLRLKPARWEDVKKLLKYGKPKIDAK